MNILGLTISERKHSDVLSNRPDEQRQEISKLEDRPIEISKLKYRKIKE